jgi:hypothetical protein
MRTVCLFIASLGFASAFLAPVPSFTPTRARATQTSMMLSPGMQAESVALEEGCEGESMGFA